MVYTKKLEFIVYAAHEKNILNFCEIFLDNFIKTEYNKL